MSRSRVVVLVLAATLLAAAFPAGAQPRVSARPDALKEQAGPFADFNGDGFQDLAVGAPTEDFGSTVDAGAISIFYGVAAGSGLPIVSQTLVQGNPEAGDHFGAALEAGPFNDDIYYDLVVGVPGENLGATADAGAVNVFFGSAGGLPATSQVLVQDNPEVGDQFGAALATGFIDGVGIYDLVVGAPGEDVGAKVDAGAANFFSSGSNGVLPPVSGPALLQDNPEAGDRFGAALATGVSGGAFGDLIVGAPGENVGATVDAGAANVFTNPSGMVPAVSNQTLLQGNPEAGDQFGAALDF